MQKKDVFLSRSPIFIRSRALEISLGLTSPGQIFATFLFFSRATHLVVVERERPRGW